MPVGEMEVVAAVGTSGRRWKRAMIFSKVCVGS